MSPFVMLIVLIGLSLAAFVVFSWPDWSEYRRQARRPQTGGYHCLWEACEDDPNFAYHPACTKALIAAQTADYEQTGRWREKGCDC